jgi:hypothetical protein
MYFFLEKHTYKNDGFDPVTFDILKANDLKKVKSYIINKLKNKAKEIKYYYDDPYHVYDYLDLNDINHVFRFGKITKNEVDKTLEEFDDVKVIII